MRRIEGVSAYIRRLSSTCPGVRAAGCPRFLALCPGPLQAGLCHFADGLHLVNPLISISLCKSMTAALASGVLMLSPMTTIPTFCLGGPDSIAGPYPRHQLVLGGVGPGPVAHLVGEDMPFAGRHLLEFVNLSLQDKVALPLSLTRA